jgi:hypothetical protein
MIKRPITYETVDGETVTEDFWFNLSKIEMLRLEAQVGTGLLGFFQRIANSNDPKLILEEFEKFVLLTYGERSPDGRSHIKTEEAVSAFEQTMAYRQLAWELGTNADKAADFVNGVIPQISEAEVKEMEASAAKMREQMSELEKASGEATLPTRLAPESYQPAAPAFPPPPPATPQEFTLPPEPA